MHRSRGFTLTELMITIAILAVLLGIGVPSFLDFIRNNRVSTQVNELATALNFARSEAVKRGVNVQITSIGGSLVNGWCIHLTTDVVSNADCSSLTPPATVMRSHAALQDITLTPALANVTYGRLGQKDSPAGEVGFTIIPTACSAGAQRARIVTVSPGGRVSVQRTACP